MQGNPDNAVIWTDADVWVSHAPAPVLPETIDDPFGPDWDLVGLLDGDGGFGKKREWDETELFAWGAGLIKITRKHFKLTATFTALEDNKTTRGLLWPGSTDTLITVPKPAQVWVAFQNVGDEGQRERWITRRKADVWSEADDKKEGEGLKREYTVRVFATAAGELFTRQADPDPDSPAPAGLVSLADYRPAATTAEPEQQAA